MLNNAFEHFFPVFFVKVFQVKVRVCASLPVFTFFLLPFLHKDRELGTPLLAVFDQDLLFFWKY